MSTVRELFSLLTSEQRRKFYQLQVLVIFMALAEVSGVAAIGPFMILVGDSSVLEGSGYLARLYQYSGLEDKTRFMFLCGIGVLCVLFAGSMVSIMASWKLSRYSTSVGAELASRLYAYYMHQPWIYHANNNSSTLTNKIASESGRITTQVLTPLMQINARAVLSFFLLLTVFLYNPVAGLVGGATFSLAYLLIYRVVRTRLDRSGKAMSVEQALRFRLLAEGFGGVKDVLLLGRQESFTTSFQESSSRFAKRQSNVQILSQAPRYLVELIAFSALIFLTLYLLKSQEKGATELLASLAVYGLAGFKLVPALQAIYSQMALIKSGMPAFLNVREDLKSCAEQERCSKVAENNGLHSASKIIQLKNINFTYPNKSEPALNDFSIEIPVKKTVGLVGASGSGKSTAIDMLLGLLKPCSGEISVDGKGVTDENRRSWQKMLGYVPQAIFLSGASIRENIAFGLPANEIDDSLVQRAIKLAHLEETVDALPDGPNTKVGERGVQLSGGQRQRIGIARALYHDADILVLDEATSALDGLTEKLIMDAIHDFSGKKTLVMIAHRLATVKKCDIIYLLDRGRVLDGGTYDELIERNPMFKEMADHA